LTDQTPDNSPLKNILDYFQNGARAVTKAPFGPIPDAEKQDIDDNINLYFGYISAIYSQKTTGARGVGETKGAGKFMHSYHAKRFL